MTTETFDLEAWLAEIEKDHKKLSNRLRRVLRKVERWPRLLLGDNGNWPVMDIRVRWKRGKHGITRSDAWNLDTYLLMVVERGLRHLIAMGNSYPPKTADGREWDDTSWFAHLELLANKLERSLNVVDEVIDSPDYKLGDGKVEAAEREAVRLRTEVLTDMIGIWDSLWD